MTPWGKKAAEFGRIIPEDRLRSDALAPWLDSSAMGAVACSGGADSLALLLLLWAHFPESHSRLRVLHYDHRLRGAESAQDAEFVREVSQALGLPCILGEWSGTPVEATGEAKLRAARHAFFAAQGVDFVFQGHHRDDVAETLLMRLGMGWPITSLDAPRPVQTIGNWTALRPLLGLSKAKLTAALHSTGIPWREDRTNASSQYTRNSLRLSVLPALEEAIPQGFAKGAGRTRELAGEIAQDFAQRFEKWWTTSRSTETEADFSAALDESPALTRYCLRRWLEMNGALTSVSPENEDEILAALQDTVSCRLSAGAGGWLTVSGSKVSFDAAAVLPTWPAVALAAGTSAFLPGGARLQLRKVGLDESLKAKILSGQVDPQHEAWLATEATTLRVRRWQAGDRYRPLGAPGAQKLQDMFVNRKIPLKERTILPVTCLDTEILWVPGCPPNAAYQLRRDTKVALQLTYIR